jgi:hypothetical protein
MTNEEFYDKEIAPALIRLSRQCKGRGMSLLAHVEFDDDGIGTTASLEKDCSFATEMAHMAIQSAGNVDALILALMKYGRKNGHSSICLAQLGVPEKGTGLTVPSDKVG